MNGMYEKCWLIQFLSHLLKTTADAILFINLEGTITIANEAAGKILKQDMGKILRQKFWDVFEDEMFGFSMSEALRFGISHRLIYRHTMEISTAFIYEGPKTHHGMFITLKDSSEKESLRLLANRNDKMKELGEMAATVAHEIRNPLGGIRGYASLLFKDLENSPHLQEMAGFIMEATKAMERIVHAILHFSKPIQIEPRSIDIGAFLKKIGKFIKIDPAFPSNVKLLFHIPDAPLLVPFDEGALKQALLNLIFNAFQAMPKGGELSLSLLKLESSCQITVSDTGLGLSEEQLELLFSPFYTTKKTGNGLGLVETHKIIQAHFGTVVPHSILGKGTTFTILLPLKR
ncbi:MAG: Sensor protein [uncultured bacterium]|nr:MAG: Sensor protein [uncultured bacterium]